MDPVIDHFGINCSDWAKSQEFYDNVLRVLGYSRQKDFGVAVGYGSDGHAPFWIADAGAGAADGPNREAHIAFAAKSSAEVQAFYRTALALGAEPLHEPRLWPEYHDTYYGAFVRDPDGNNVEAVYHGGGPADHGDTHGSLGPNPYA
ncbi:MAG: Glyoxalase/bleomycin resistance protein/dioxygenase [Mycobacterium sp.]|jgi:catechol 2,3-dioxygenase-like lactoylglutathione lyase family enzyme|nr:Glyoxalase/bleomycin resistance protein/dioxygenase [Mycobacterium sp.]